MRDDTPSSRWGRCGRAGRRIVLRLASLALLALPGCAIAGGGAANSSTSGATPEPPHPKPRVVVLTDIGGGEPDDEQSLIRLLLYSNELAIEGLVANTSAWQRDEIHPQLIRAAIEAYRRVRPNLAVHASGYPSADSLLQVVREGRVAVGMEGVGDGMSTAASEHIIGVVDRPDPRPVWVQLWGGGLDLAQALWDVRARRTPDQTAAFVAKLRVYEIAGQDDTGAWATHTFPELFWIRSVVQFQSISRRFDNNKQWEHARGGNEAVMERDWVEEHVQSHGPLGALYRHAAYKYEGDSPAFLHLLPTGLGDPEQPHFGSWGGRFEPERQRNLGAVPRVTTQQRYHDYWMFGDAVDSWSYGAVSYRNQFAALFRWREDFQNDFAARMDWSVTPTYDDANHNPVAALDGDASRAIVYRSVRAGERISLSAAGSSDPDGDRLAFEWFHYPEPGTHPGEIAIADPTAERTTLSLPVVDAPRTIHLVLTVRDDGEPRLSSYKRLVLTVLPG